jgi:hypothetical protein
MQDNVWTDEDRYGWFVEQNEPHGPRIFPTEAQLAKWRPRLPEPLLRHWQTVGWGGFNRGKYWVCDPDLLRPVIEALFTGDPDFHPDDLIPLGYNALGEIDVFMGRGRTMSLDLPDGFVRWRDGSKSLDGLRDVSDFAVIYHALDEGMYANGELRLDSDGADMFVPAAERLGELQSGEIYGFFPALALGGASRVENMEKAPLIEHLLFLIELKTPTLYDYARPEGDEGGFGTLIPRRFVGPQD